MTYQLSSAKQTFCKGFSFLRTTFFLLPILGVLVPYALPLWIGLTSFIGLGIILYQNENKRDQFKDLLNHRFQKKKTTLPVIFLTAVVVFSLWMGLSTLWAPDFARSFRLFISLNILFLSGFLLTCLLQLLDKKHLRFLGFSFFLGCLITLLFLTLDIYFEGKIRNFIKTGQYILLKKDDGLAPYSQGATFLAVILWPLLGLVYRFHRLLSLPFLIAVPCLLTQLQSHAAVAGTAVGALVFLLVYTLRKPALLTGSALTFIVMVAAPQLTVKFLDPVEIEESLPGQAKASYSHRLWIWQYVSHRVFEKPLKGWGLDSSRTPEFDQSMLWYSDRFCLKKGQKRGGLSCDDEALPLHPHNMALQIWLELGVIGSILAALIISLFPLLVAYCPVSRFGKALAASAYACSLTIGFIAYGVWQNWWVSTLLIGIAMTGWLLKIERKAPPDLISEKSSKKKETRNHPQKEIFKDIWF